MQRPDQQNPPDPNIYPRVVQRVERSPKWGLVVPIIFVFIVLIFWKQITDMAAEQARVIEEALQSEEERHRKEAQKRDERNRAKPAKLSFDEELDQALYHARNNNRDKAHEIFKSLLKESTKKAVYDEQTAALLPRAAAFYHKGNEIPTKQVEYLYLDSLDAFKQVHGKNYYDYENVYTGLEKLYQEHKLFDLAANQTRALLAFYNRKHEQNEDYRFALVHPTTVRLGNNLLAAGKPEAARKAYEDALTLGKTRNYNVRPVEYLIQKTYEENTAGTLPEIPPSAFGIQLVAPPGINPAPQTTKEDRQSKEELNLLATLKAIQIEGLVVEDISETEKEFRITGHAVENKTVAGYMRKLQENVGDPILYFIKKDEREGEKTNSFSLGVKKE